MLDEESKAVQEVAKASGKAIDASREMGGFIAKYVGGTLEQAMGIWEDKLKYRRWENQIRLVQKARDYLQARKMIEPTRSIPLSLALPLFEEGTLADDEVLRDRWGMLLANAADANGPEVRRAYISVLAEMTPFDALVLDMLFDADANASPNPTGDPIELATVDLPDQVSLPIATTNVVELKQEAKEVMRQKLRPDIELSLVNLARLGLICSAAAFGGTANMRWVSLTELGRQFVIACRPINIVDTGGKR